MLVNVRSSFTCAALAACFHSIASLARTLVAPNSVLADHCLWVAGVEAQTAFIKVYEETE